MLVMLSSELDNEDSSKQDMGRITTAGLVTTCIFFTILQAQHRLVWID
jgi:hypothetical protein